MEDNKIFFLPGEKVTIKLDIPNKPVMMVVKKVTSMFKKEQDEGVLKGILCRWFTINGELQEAVFNTKDLIKV